MSRLLGFAVATVTLCTLLVFIQVKANNDEESHAKFLRTDVATGELPSTAQSRADLADASVDVGKNSLPDSATLPPDIAETQEPKPPSNFEQVKDRENQAERDDLREAIERDNAEDHEDKRERRERLAYNREAAETLAWSYFLGTHDTVQDIAKAKEMFIALATEGSAASQFGLGVMYATGIGMNVSQPKALLYYTLAAWGEYPLAWMALGFRYFSGHSTDYNCDTAALYYHHIASHVVNGMDLLGGQTVTRLRITDETDGSSNQLLDPEFVQYYQYLADKGESAAQLALGLLYLQGKHGVEQDIELAYDYLLQASEKDNAQADAYLGRMYLKGTSVTPQDFERAYQYFQRSASKESPMGMVGLGLLYTLGFHVDKDQNRAKTLFTKAAEQGNAEGQLQLGNFFFRSQAPSSLAQMLSSVKNMKQAVKYWNMASQQGSALAYYNLGIAHVYGHGTPRMCRIGTEFLKIVAERGKHSQYFMSAYEDYRHGNVDSALAKYALLAELGYETAHSNLAILYERKIDLRVSMPLLFSAYPGSTMQPENGTDIVTTVKPSIKPPRKSYRILYINNNIPLMEDDAMRRAFYYWSQSAELGYAYARIRLGDYHFYGTGTPVNYAEAMLQYKAAADNHHNAQAMFNLGYMHEKGLGGTKDLHLAKRFYDLAIDTSSDAYLPCHLALSKLNLLFTWQRIKESGFYAATPDVEAWFGENWDLLLITVVSLFFAAMWYYVKVVRPRAHRAADEIRRARAVPAPSVSTAAAAASSSAAAPVSATATNQPLAATKAVSDTDTLSAGSGGTSHVGNPASRSFTNSSGDSSSNSAAANNDKDAAKRRLGDAVSTTTAANYDFPGPVPTTRLRSTTTAPIASNSSSSTSMLSSSVTGSSLYHHKDKDSGDEMERAATDDSQTYDLTVSKSVDDDVRSSSTARRRTSMINRQDEPTVTSSGSSSSSAAKDSNPPPAAWPSDID